MARCSKTVAVTRSEGRMCSARLCTFAPRESPPVFVSTEIFLDRVASLLPSDNAISFVRATAYFPCCRTQTDDRAETRTGRNKREKLAGNQVFIVDPCRGNSGKVNIPDASVLAESPFHPAIYPRELTATSNGENERASSAWDVERAHSHSIFARGFIIERIDGLQ